jgi:hypothetical protein
MALAALAASEPAVVVPAADKVRDGPFFVDEVEPPEESENLDGNVGEAGVGLAPPVAGVGARGLREGLDV